MADIDENTGAAATLELDEAPMVEQADQFRTTLTRAERALLRGFNIPDGVRKQLETESPHPAEVWMTVDEAADLREQVSERLQLDGFDADYKHTELGRTLETLIDKLYTG